jgi:arsenical resistance operon trans-acting repressor ArsD
MKADTMSIVTIRVFEPPVDGPGGFCNTSRDPHLVRFACDLAWLQQNGIRVERFDIARDPGAFVQTRVVKEALTRGPQVLPLVLVDDRIGHEGSYPSRETLAQLAGLSAS